MKFKITSVLIIVIGLISATIWWFSQASLTIKSPLDNLEISLISDNKTYTMLINQTKRLPKAKYELRLNSDKYQIKNNEVNLNSSQTIDLEIDYSDKYEQENLATQTVQIREFLQSKYGQEKFVVGEKIDFVNLGEYAVGYITKYPENPALFGEFDILKVIFRQTNDNWQPITEPQLIFWEKKYPDIPKNVIDTANDIVSVL